MLGYLDPLFASRHWSTLRGRIGWPVAAGGLIAARPTTTAPCWRRPLRSPLTPRSRTGSDSPSAAGPAAAAAVVVPLWPRGSGLNMPESFKITERHDGSLATPATSGGSSGVCRWRVSGRALARVRCGRDSRHQPRHRAGIPEPSYCGCVSTIPTMAWRCDAVWRASWFLMAALALFLLHAYATPRRRSMRITVRRHPAAGNRRGWPAALPTSDGSSAIFAQSESLYGISEYGVGYALPARLPSSTNRSAGARELCRIRVARCAVPRRMLTSHWRPATAEGPQRGRRAAEATLFG